MGRVPSLRGLYLGQAKGRGEQFPTSPHFQFPLSRFRVPRFKIIPIRLC